MEENISVNTEIVTKIKGYIPESGLLADMCAFFSVFSDVTRVRILTALSICELCVGDISLILELNQTTVSHQLKLLRDAGMVTTRREGKIVYYKTIDNHINDIMLTGVEHVTKTVS